MAKKQQLRTTRAGTIINVTSKKQETDAVRALAAVVDHLSDKYKEKLFLVHDSQWPVGAIVDGLKESFPEVEFDYHFPTSSIRPDGGILSIRGGNGDLRKYPILIVEVKNQGTNDLRAIEGLPKQAKGNAIERLGKNVIGLRAALLKEGIFPFVCFGYGCDFESDSSILDRVTTIAMFGKLNKTYLHNQENDKFNRGSFYFRPEKWTLPEMIEIMKDIAERSILYYFSKYKEGYFLPA